MSRRTQSGVMLIEAMVGILIFSIGVLALVGLQAVAIKASAEAKYRADASYLANAIVGRMWNEKPANLVNYRHRPTSTAGQLCQPTGTDSSDDNVTAWLAKVAALLPGADATLQQIAVDTATNQVSVSVCWVSPQDSLPHRHMIIAYINK